MRTGRLGLPIRGHSIALMSKQTYYITKAKSRHLTDGLEGIKSENICEGRGLLRSFRKSLCVLKNHKVRVKEKPSVC